MKRTISLVLCLAALFVFLAGCGSAPSSQTSAPSAAPSSSVASSSVPQAGAEKTTFRIAGLKGPTTMGMVKLMSDAANGEARHDYQVEMYGAATEVNALLINGDIDVAAVPANVASVLYNQTGGKVRVAAINTLGVLYVVQTGNSVQSIQDLKGKTVYTTGKGQTPEFVLNYLLEQNGIDPEKDLTIEYKSEATEVAAMLAESEDAVAVLPQPYATAVQMQNENVSIALDLTQEWDKVATDSALVTGVLVARTEFIEQNEAAFVEFLEDYFESINWVNTNTPEAAQLVAEYGIVEKAPVAEKALPYCNIVYIAGNDMQTMLNGYLEVLYNQLPEAVGGKVPDELFYYGVDLLT